MKRHWPIVMALTIALTACTARGPAGFDAATRQSARGAEPGKRQFRLSCAGCHGDDARGHGPIASLLTIPVPDLTLIASRRGGLFPSETIYRIIDGQADLNAHGPRQMPVWGYEFFGDDPDDEVAHRQAAEKIERVVGYLRSVQRTP